MTISIASHRSCVCTIQGMDDQIGIGLLSISGDPVEVF